MTPMDATSPRCAPPSHPRHHERAPMQAVQPCCSCHITRLCDNATPHERCLARPTTNNMSWPYLMSLFFSLFSLFLVPPFYLEILQAIAPPPHHVTSM